MNRCGYSNSPDHVCGATPSAHLLIDKLDGRPPMSLFTCPDHIDRARTAGLVQGEHEYGASCASGDNFRWLLLTGGRSVCIAASARSTA